MAWDFTADSGMQRELAKRLTEGADNFNKEVADTYTEIANMAEYWDGTDHDAYVTGTEGYKTALEDLEKSIRMFAYQFENVLAPATEELATTCYNIIINLTSSPADAAASGGDAGAGNGDSPDGGSPDGGPDGGTPGGDGNGGGNGDQGDGTPGGGTGEGDGTPGGQGNDGTPAGDDQPTPVPTPAPDEANNYVAVADPNAETETLSADQQAEEGNPGLWEQTGGRYADSWNGMVEDVKGTWADANGLFSGLASLGITFNEWCLFCTDAGLDTIEGAVDIVDWGANWLFDLGTGRGGGTSADYWDHIGEDYAENWDYSKADNFWEGVGITFTGTVRTVLDAGQTVVNAADTAVDWVCDRASDVIDWCGDACSTIADWLF